MMRRSGRRVVFAVYAVALTIGTHWPQLAMCFLAGGGMRLGQVIGSSTKNAEYAKDRPVHFQEVLATLYHNLGIDTQSAQLTDTAGRPQYLLDKRQPIAELVG